MRFLKTSQTLQTSLICCTVTLSACGTVKRPQPLFPMYGIAKSTTKDAHIKSTKDVPGWVFREVATGGELCGSGVAGASFSDHSPYPKEMSLERAIYNLAGTLGTRVQKSIISKETNSGIRVETAQALTVDHNLIERVRAHASTSYWRDLTGAGPYGKKGFTYAHSCLDAKAMADEFEIDGEMLTELTQEESHSATDLPVWLNKGGRQSGGRLCAVGFSLPMFHPDKTFQAVVEDIRAQLAKELSTFVSEYFEQYTSSRQDAPVVKVIQTGITEAISRGAVVTHYWYDSKGLGILKKRRSTYGFGCVYPVSVIASSTQNVPEEQKQVIAEVKHRAASMFAELGDEIQNQEIDKLKIRKVEP